MASLYLRLGASLLAVAAGAVGAVVAVELLRSVPGPTSSTAATPSSAPAAPRPASIAGGRIPIRGDPAFPSPPPGAVVLSREAGSYALAVAVRGRLVRVSVLSPDGPGAAGLDVSVRSGQGASLKAAACGPGCYQVVAAEKPSSPLTVTLDGRPYRFPLPAGTADGGAIARRAAETWRALKTLVWRERLAGSPTDVVHATYRAVAPDELAYEIAGGSQAVIIGSTRWDRPTPQGRWQASEQRPKLTQPVPFWDTSLNAHVIGAGRFRGRPAWRVSFFDPATPAWFTAWIGRSDYRTLELDMVAAAHFMHHVYGPFNAPIHLVPPAS